jgi:gamma-glutamyltranspeptidase/glutathione hydrolase
MKKLIFAFSLIFFIACSSTPTQTQNAEHAVNFASDERPRTDHVEASGTQYAISTQGLYSTKAAKQILDEGGNLIDAAAAASFALAVERPQSTGLTGGGFLMYREALTGKIYAIDFRERAPLKASKKMFVGADGRPDKSLSRDSIYASGVPGFVAGIVEVHHRFGHLPLSKVVQPAIDLANNGFAVYPQLARALAARENILLSEPYAQGIFAGKDGKVLKTGDLLVQKDLAHTLEEISLHGRDGFYRGPVGKKMLAYFKTKKGLITAHDFSIYKVHWREPVRTTFHGYDVVSMPPPSSGGVHVIQFLNFLENDPMRSYGFLSTKSIHLAASSLQSAFADRARYLGDPDFVSVPVKGLTSKAYAKSRRAEVSFEKARHVDEVHAGNPLPYESSETTHFSMMDKDGNMIASTQTINGWMGSGLVVPGTGLVLNNEMDDFSAMEGTANMFGAIGGKPDSIQPQKTPLSSMSPTLVLKDGKPVLAVGAPGGTRIISCVAQTLLNVLEFQLPLFESIASIRYHHQWQPDVLQIDPPGPAPEVLKELEHLSYKVDIKPIGCTVQAVAAEGKTLHAVADPRDIGTSEAQ